MKVEVKDVAVNEIRSNGSHRYYKSGVGKPYYKELNHIAVRCISVVAYSKTIKATWRGGPITGSPWPT